MARGEKEDRVESRNSHRRIAPSNLVDVRNRIRKTLPAQLFMRSTLLVCLLTAPCGAWALPAGGQGARQTGQTVPAEPSGPPPSSVGFFPLDQVKRGMTGTAWTVFEGTKPEPMQVEILGVLHGARGPHRDLILARLHGAKPEYTGVVAGMSGSPVYVEGKLLGALSYRIGQFSKEPIAGITPIAQMLEVRDLPEREPVMPTIEHAAISAESNSVAANSGPLQGLGESSRDFAAIETPLVMSGFSPEAIHLWKERVAGTGLDAIAAGGQAGSTDADFGPVVPGSAVSLQLMRGDLEIAATCTVTYVDPKRLLACGHPIMQSGTVSLPMTSTEVVATLASPLNAFKIVNTGKVIGSFTQDRDAAIGGVLGLEARMIPLSLAISGAGFSTNYHVEVLDHSSLTGSAVLVSIFQLLQQSNQGTSETSYHITGEIRLHGMPPVAVNSWGTPGEPMAPQLAAALGVADSFNRLYENASRLTPMEGVELHVEAIPHDVRTQLESVRLVSSSIVHAGSRVEIEATLRPWEQPVRNVRLSFTVPARTAPGTLRLLVGSALSLDRTLDAARPPGAPLDESGTAARLRAQHPADQVYASLLMPETQASVAGRTLDSLPLSMANTLEPERGDAEVGLHGESLVVAAQAPAGGVLAGQQLLSLRVEAGGGLD